MISHSEKEEFAESFIILDNAILNPYCSFSVSIRK